MATPSFPLVVSCAFAAALGVPAGAQPADEVAFVKALFAKLNPRSIAENVEYCGFIGYGRDGEIVASRPRRGDADSCAAPWPLKFDVVASYHTHAAFDPDAWSEIPSGIDMETDEESGIDGYVATPGGRLWYIDTEDMVTWQICGIGCLPQDPRFDPSVDGPIERSYSYKELVYKLAK